MKTKRLARAAVSGSVGPSNAQACGFVSKIIVKRDGEGSESLVSADSVVQVCAGAHRLILCYSDQSRL